MTLRSGSSLSSSIIKVKGQSNLCVCVWGGGVGGSFFLILGNMELRKHRAGEYKAGEHRAMGI